MKNIKLTDIIIDEFILGRLSSEESQLFLKKVEKDANLARQVEMRRSIIEGLETTGRKQLKTELQSIHEEIMNERATQAKKGRIRPFLAVAAAAVLTLLLALPNLVFPKQGQNIAQLYTAYFQPYEVERSQRSEKREALFEFKKLYKEKAYAEALPLLEAEFKNWEQRPNDLVLLAGVIYLELDIPEKALVCFEEIIAKKDIGLGDVAIWYKALTHLKAEQVALAKQSLEKLVTDEYADFHQEARDLIQKIDLIIKE